MTNKRIIAVVGGCLMLVLLIGGGVYIGLNRQEDWLAKETWGDILQADPSLNKMEGMIVDSQKHSQSSVEALPKLLDRRALARLKKGGYTVAICMHGMNDVRNDWSLLQVAGLRKTFAKLGVRVLVVTDGEFDIEKQISDYQHVIALKPDALVTIPIDSGRAAPILKAAAAQGIKIVFMDSVPDGFVAGRDYVGMVMADSYANAWLSGKLLAEKIGGSGRVALIHWSNRMFTCDERSRGVRDVLKKYPDITVTEEYFVGFYEVRQIAQRLLEEQPDLKGMWVVWDTPAFEAMKAIRALKRSTYVSTIDLSYDTACEIVGGDILLGTGTQHPYHQGVAEALMTGVALAGKTPPPFIMIPGELVTRENIAEAWGHVFLEPIPEKVLQYKPGKGL